MEIFSDINFLNICYIKKFVFFLTFCLFLITCILLFLSLIKRVLILIHINIINDCLYMLNFILLFFYSLISVFLTKISKLFTMQFIQNIIYNNDTYTNDNKTNTNTNSNIVFIKTYRCLPEYFVFNYHDDFYLAACFCDYLITQSNCLLIPDIHCINGKQWFLPIEFFLYFLNFLNDKHYNFNIIENECLCIFLDQECESYLTYV